MKTVLLETEFYLLYRVSGDQSLYRDQWPVTHLSEQIDLIDKSILKCFFQITRIKQHQERKGMKYFCRYKKGWRVQVRLSSVSNTARAKIDKQLFYLDQLRCHKIWFSSAAQTKRVIKYLLPTNERLLFTEYSKWNEKIILKFYRFLPAIFTGTRQNTTIKTKLR